MASPVLLITGCSTGIGRDLATTLHSAGYTVVATARRKESLADLPVAKKLALDVQQPAQVQAAVSETIQTYGRIDVLINNAGYGDMGALEECDEARLHQQFDVNVLGVMRMIRAVLPQMRQQGSGRIINLSSVAGRISMPFLGAYCGTKFAVEAMSDALRGELAPFGIQVVVIEPGAIRTNFEETAVANLHSGRADSPYQRYYEAVQRMFASQNKNAPGPEAVTRVIRRAIESPRPRARYQVPASAAWAVRFAALVPDRILDSITRRVLLRVPGEPHR